MEVISKSDIVILVVASSALALGIFRWHQNTQDVSAITIPASSRVVVEPEQNSVASNGTRVIDASASVAQLQQQTAQVTVQTIAEPAIISGIVVSENVQPTSNNSIQLGSHVVRSGDYLGKIANQYGTDVDTLRDLNGISGTVIQIGQEILYPL